VSGIFTKLLDAEDMFTVESLQYREKMKEIKKREMQIQTLKARVKTAQDKHKENVKKQKPSDQSKYEAEALEEELAKLVAEHEGSKRAEIRDALRIKFAACTQLAIKVHRLAFFLKVSN
jgi:NACalpha-BTF3-like transcription factor